MKKGFSLRNEKPQHISNRFSQNVTLSLWGLVTDLPPICVLSLLILQLEIIFIADYTFAYFLNY